MSGHLKMISISLNGESHPQILDGLKMKKMNRNKKISLIIVQKRPCF
jgi:hypothetical protein